MSELLKAAIGSGQVSAAQIEAHRAAGELPITMHDLGFVDQYAGTVFDKTKKPQTLRETIDGATGEDMHVWCKVADVRKALDDAERYRLLRNIGGKSWTDITTGEIAKNELYDLVVDAAIASKGAQP